MTIILIHAGLALAALLWGSHILVMPKGTALHKKLGWVWVFLMTATSITAIFIQEFRPGQFSAIHFLIPFTLVMLFHALWNIRRFKKTGIERYRNAHKRGMIGVFFFSLVLTGALTLLPGRFFYRLLIGE